ncbi:MAG: peptide chain release factor 2 [bacterium]|nr:peptide chain release factor 2 [bacterium]
MDAQNVNFVEILQEFKTRIASLTERLDLEAKKRQLEGLETQTNQADFWSNPKTAQQTMQTVSKLKTEIEAWDSVQRRIADALELAELGDDGLNAELSSEITSLQALVDKMALQAMLSGPYDNEDAILAIHAGAGGTDSQDWGAMLERMYLRWADQSGYKVELIEEMEGEEAGIKSATLSIRGAYAYGYLQSEQGVHRLVRLSPFDAANRRHTSFVKVELWPDIQGDINIEVNDKDIRVETYRASGAGGQNVQKNETAIRITHIPTGLVVQCQNQRSLQQNRERALQILKARLFEMERKKREAHLAQLKGETVSAEWGNQIRSYVLHPYHMVNDHRTGYKVGNTDAVLNGEIMPFMESFLHAKITNSFSAEAQEQGELET